MNRRLESHPFFGYYSPLSTFSSAGLIIMASGRFSFALLCAAALVWVYGLTALVFSAARAILPARGKKAVLLFLSAFFCGVFILLVNLFNPLLIFASGFFLLLVPPCCMGSRLFEAQEATLAPAALCAQALIKAAVLSGIILAVALIREPLGMGTLSFPAGIQGVVEVFDIRGENHFVPVRFLSASAGGLVLLGYGTALFRYFRDRSGSAPPNEAPEGEQ